MSNFQTLRDDVTHSPNAASISPKVQPDHLTRNAVLYIRQSTLHQLREHQESTTRQYQLRHRLEYLGWSPDKIVIIDDDLGVSGSNSDQREGFRRLLKLVTEQQAGIVLGLEMSRLARNSKDWHDLFEVCAIFDSLIADEDGVFDPNDPNDRLVLGLRGIINELELHTMKVRLERGRLSKAERGELFHEMPVGYVRDEAGLPQKDLDESARHAMENFFRLFQTLGSAHRLFHHLAEHQIKLPFRNGGGPIDWRVPGKTTVYEVLKHPLYAGAYGYGIRKNYRKPRKPGQNPGKKYLPPEAWKVFLKDRFAGYISWDEYQANQQRMRDNCSHKDRQGSPRSGAALLAGIVYCGSCGRRMSPNYSAHSKGSYYCNRHSTLSATIACKNTIVARVLDEFIAEKVLEALGPSAIELSLQAVEDESVRRAQLEMQYIHRVQRAQYEVDLARRRYEAVDPANRLVASTLEEQWEASLVELQTSEGELQAFRDQQSVELSETERGQIQSACCDLVTLWQEGATHSERKEIARFLIKRVEISVADNSQRVTVLIRWAGGFESCHEIARPVSRYQQLDGYREMLDRALELALTGKRSPEIAKILQSEGYVTARNRKPISADMVVKLLHDDERCAKQLRDPDLVPSHWRSRDLAEVLGLPEKRLKDWVTRGWAHAIQRPFGRTWIIWADAGELQRLRALVVSQRGQGSALPAKELRTPRLPNRENL